MSRLSCTVDWPRFIQSFFTSLYAELTKLTRTWRKTWIQRPKQPWSTQEIRQMFQHPQHCRSSLKSRCLKIPWKRRMIASERVAMMMQTNHRNQDCASCFRCFSFSWHSQRCWVYSSSTWIHRVSKIILFGVNCALDFWWAPLINLNWWLRSIKERFNKSNLANVKINDLRCWMVH